MNNNWGGNYRGKGNWRGFNKPGNFRGSLGYGSGFRLNGPRGGYGGPMRPGPNRGNFRGRHQHFGKFNWPKRDAPSKRLSEEQIGATEYISDHKGFNGIIKSRYSDFQVSEINENGEVAKLTDLNAPSLPSEETVEEDEELLLNKYNLEILPMETWDNINKIVCSENSTEKVEIDVTGMTKEQRTKIHEAVKKAFGSSVVGSTVTVDDKKIVQFVKFKKGVRIDTRQKWVWPGEYVHFIVYKENCDTMDAAAKIAEGLRMNMKSNMVGYAGVKDRRAKTSQWFSLRRVDPRRVVGAAKCLRDVRVGNFSFSAKHLKLGMLKGNKFKIALRNVKAEDEVINNACELLQKNGFVNYYGLQRFGTRIETPTYEIGLRLLRSEFKEAIDLILEEREGPLQRILSKYHLAGAQAAALLLPKKAAPHSPHLPAPELALLRALALRPNDLHGALDRIPRNTRMLYLHSYQSLVWNRAVSLRLQRLGRAPAPGDLVPAAGCLPPDLHEDDESDGDDDKEPDDEDNQEENKEVEKPIDNIEAENSPQDNDTEVKKENDEEDKPALKVDTEKNVPKQMIPVKVLTQEDIDSGKYTLFDIVMPLPGHEVQYPPNMVDAYEEMLTKDGLTLKMEHKHKRYGVQGRYRHVALRPGAVTWQLVRYSEPLADLLLSDLDVLQARTDTGVREDGKYKALLLTLTLPSSCYATMALRELLRVDTSCDNQAQQNNYHMKDKEDANAGNVQVKMEDDAEEEKESESAGKRKLESEEDEVAKKIKQEE